MLLSNVFAFLVAVQCCGVQGDEITLMLKSLTTLTPPMVPSSLNSELQSLVGDVSEFVKYPNNLQRALLWSAGWIRAIPESAGSGSASDGEGQYVQMYVQCGLTMSRIFLTASTFFNESSCDLQTCKNHVITYTMPTCDPSFVESKALCALSPDATLSKKYGPMWSTDGSFDESFDPQFYQFNNTNGGKSTIYMLAQTSSWQMTDEVCPNSAKFIVPCRKINADEIGESRYPGSEWCEPEIESWVKDWVKTKSSANATESEGPSTSAIVGIVAAGIVVVLIFLGTIAARRRKSKASQGQTGLWDDDIITANRIPREKVRIDQLISRGAFGEVYSGMYNDQKVAVKMLLPSTRRDIKFVNAFLAEARLTATMEHPRVVSCVGIAWDALSDLCVVLEFVEGGDLRTLLSNYERSSYPVGFNREKVTIALHVAHALTYLHSLQLPVIHRDLKSRNILLNHMLEAKLTDFGISREHLDQTMTAGVGTSLWMAPEVMRGEKYDEKADMFSFGVVVSELDVHSLPYAQVKQEMQNSHGRQMTDATLLQRVAMGTVSVCFSNAGPQPMFELGKACVSMAPNLRPSAAEALFELQVILSKEMANVQS